MRESRTPSETHDVYSIDELRFYYLKLELQSVSWFSSLTQPHINSYVQTQLPVIHNYPLLLALGGHIVEESYVSGYNIYKRKESPATKFKDYKIYVYPLRLRKAHYKGLLLSMSETDYILYKPQTKLIVPTITYYNALAPGTMGEVLLIAAHDPRVREGNYIRLGAKRYGVWKIEKLVEVKYGGELKVRGNGAGLEVNGPFNVADIRSEDLIKYSVVLTHYAGDIALAGIAKRCFEVRINNEVLRTPIPFFISTPT